MAHARKLPPLKTVGAAYRYVFAHLPQVARLCSGWLGVAIVLFAVSAALLAQILRSNSHAAVEFQSSADLQVSAMLGLPMLVLFLATPTIIVAWHRVIIRNVSPAIFPFPIGAAILYVARTILIGFIWPLTVGLIGLLPIVYFRHLAIDPALKLALEAALVAGAGVLGALITARLLLVLPAGAVGDWSVTLAKSWRMTAGNSWRMLAGFVLAALPALALNAAANLLFRAVEDAAVAPRAAVSVIAVSLLLSLAAAILEASFLSFAYLFFAAENRSEAT